MRKLRLAISCFSLLLPAAIFLNCGVTENRFKSLTISPPSADAKDYPNSQVQFTATATFINGRQVSTANVLWTQNPPWTLAPQIPVYPIFVNGEGLTTCANVSAGLYAVYATAPVDPNFPLAKMIMSTPQVGDMATLTCP